MTQRKKIGLATTLVLLLLSTLVCTVALAAVPTANAAAPAVEDRDTWVNTYSGSYYDNLNTDKQGKEFRAELAELITSTHKTFTVYDGSSSLALNNVWTKSDVADVHNPNNGKIKWFYTGTVVSANNYGGSNGKTNREHVWPKDGGNAFPKESGPGADAHHLRPTECQLNSIRGSLSFDEVPQTTSNIAKQNGSTTYATGDGLCYKSGSFFYPAKGYRGATARILFYMQTRWGDQNSLYFVDGAGHSKSIGKISTLLKWHLEEPPNEDEIYRNNIVAGIQGNRNPFIDHPEYAEMIYCYDGKSYNKTLQDVVDTYGSYLDNVNPKPAPTAITLSPSSLSLNVGATQTITASVTPADANGSLNWKSDKTSVATVTNGVVRAVGEGVAVITATSKVNSAVSASVTVNVTEPSVQSLSISPSALSLTVGGTRQLTVTATPSGASNAVTWSSNAPSVVNVNANGFVTAVSEGEAIITATSVKTLGVTATLVVKVVSQQVNTQDFNNAMSAIENAVTLQQRYDAIKRAIDAYNNMDAASKSAVATDYAALLEQIDKYNQDVGGYNDEFLAATDFGAQTAAVGISAVFLALAAILGKRLGR